METTCPTMKADTRVPFTLPRPPLPNLLSTDRHLLRLRRVPLPCLRPITSHSLPSLVRLGSHCPDYVRSGKNGPRLPVTFVLPLIAIVRAFSWSAEVTTPASFQLR